MGRQPCCDKVGLKKGPWTAEEDRKLINFILTNGQCCWRAVPKLAGLLRCGKSCRLRWTNYLRPDLKRGLLSDYEEKLVIDLHAQLGNRWSKIASHLAGRTDNEIKNHWNTHIKKKLRKMGIDPLTHKPLQLSDQTQIMITEQQQQPKNPEPDQDKNHLNQPQPCHVTPEAQETGEDQNQANTLSLFNAMDNIQLLDNNTDGSFCTDEVPMMDPQEISVSDHQNSSSSSSSIHQQYYSSAMNTNDDDILVNLQFPDDMEFLWPLEPSDDVNSSNNQLDEMLGGALWDGDDELMNCWDFANDFRSTIMPICP